MMTHICAGKIPGQNIGAGNYRTSRRLRPFSAHFQAKADMACTLRFGIISMSKLKNTKEIKYV